MEYQASIAMEHSFVDTFESLDLIDCLYIKCIRPHSTSHLPPTMTVIGGAISLTPFISIPSTLV